MENFSDAEIAVLGGIFYAPDKLDEVRELLSPGDFYSRKLAEIYSAMITLSDKNETVDLIGVSRSLQSSGKLDEVGGMFFLTGLVSSVTSAANILVHASMVKDDALKRRVGHIGREIVTFSEESSFSGKEALDAAEKIFFNLAVQRANGGAVQIGKRMEAAFSKVEAFHASQGGITGVPSSINSLDILTTGWQKSDLIIVAGRPSMGKTAAALTFALQAAKSGTPVCFFSLEMSTEQIMLRLLCMDARVNSQRMRSGKLSREDFQRLAASINALSPLNFYIDDTPALTVQNLRSRARLMRAKHNVGLFAVDYLQLARYQVEKGRAMENRTVEVSLISQSLKAMAKELDVPVIALSQLSRAVEQRGGDKRPVLSDLRESGAIEQDADVVMFVYRPEVYDRVENEGEAEFILAKQRNGPLGTAKVIYRKEYTLFENLSGKPAVTGDPYSGYDGETKAPF